MGGMEGLDGLAGLRIEHHLVEVALHLCLHDLRVAMVEALDAGFADALGPARHERPEPGVELEMADVASDIGTSRRPLMIGEIGKRVLEGCEALLDLLLVELLGEIVVVLQARVELERLEHIGALAAQKIGLALLLGIALKGIRGSEVHIGAVEVMRDDGWHWEPSSRSCARKRKCTSLQYPIPGALADLSHETHLCRSAGGCCLSISTRKGRGSFWGMPVNRGLAACTAPASLPSRRMAAFLELGRMPYRSGSMGDDECG